MFGQKFKVYDTKYNQEYSLGFRIKKLHIFLRDWEGGQLGLFIWYHIFPSKLTANLMSRCKLSVVKIIVYGAKYALKKFMVQSIIENIIYGDKM